MKKLILLFSFISVGILYNCSYQEEVFINDTSIDSGYQVSNFFSAVDSLNLSFPDDYSTRGSFWSGSTKFLADAAGSLVGGYAGSTAGLGLGVVTGNPVVGVAGWAVGRKVGSLACAAIFSGIASYVIDYQVSIDATANEAAICIWDCNIITIIEGEECDSLGYYHNLIMSRITKDHSKYILSDGINFSLLYDDIIGYCQEYGFDIQVFRHKVIKNELIHLACIAADNSKFAFEEAVLKNCELLQSLQVPENRISIYSNLCLTIGRKLSQLSEETISDYSDNLNELIQNSHLDEENVEIIQGTTQILVNSALCWK